MMTVVKPLGTTRGATMRTTICTTIASKEMATVISARTVISSSGT